MRSPMPRVMLFALFIIAVAGCTTQREQKQLASTMCEGRYEEGSVEFNKSLVAMCDAAIEGMVEVLALISAERQAGVVCITRDFDMADYKKRFRSTLRDENVSLSGLGAVMVATLMVRGNSGEDCGWRPKQTIAAVEENCRWVPAVYGSNSTARREAMARELGISDESEIEDLAKGSALRCLGYYQGAVMAGALANGLYSKAVYCKSGRREGMSGELSYPSMERLQRVVEKLYDEPEVPTGLAARFFHEELSKEFPCPQSTS